MPEETLKDFIYKNVSNSSEKFFVGLTQNFVRIHLKDKDLTDQERADLKTLLDCDEDFINLEICGVGILRLPDGGVKCCDCDILHEKAVFKPE